MSNFTKMENVLIANSAVLYKKFIATKNLVVFPPHWHKRIEMLHIIKGCLEITMDEEVLLLKENDLCYIRSALPHSGISRSGNLEYEMVQFRESELQQILTTNKELLQFSENNIEIEKQFQDEYIATLFKHIADYNQNKSVFQNTLFLGIIYEIFGHLAIKHSSAPKTNIYKNDKFSKILKYIDKNHIEITSISEVAEKFSFEPTYFSRVFKKNMGVSANYYICCLKLEDSEKLLADTNLSMEIVSQKCGFNSASYFTKCFKKRYGISPIQYRNCNITIQN